MNPLGEVIEDLHPWLVRKVQAHHFIQPKAGIGIVIASHVDQPNFLVRLQHTSDQDSEEIADNADDAAKPSIDIDRGSFRSLVVT